MPRKRMIDPGIWHSEQVARLTLRQRLLFIGLISNADDEGKLKGSANYVKSIIFPYDSIPILTIEADLKRIASQSLIVRYRVAESWYIYLPTWKKHQYIREPRPSHVPNPPGVSTPPSTPPPTLKQQQPKPSQNNITQPKTDEPKTDEGLSAGWKLLLSFGVAKTKAYDLASNHPYQRIKKVCQYAKRANNPAGLIIKTLEKGWQTSKGGDKL